MMRDGVGRREPLRMGNGPPWVPWREGWTEGGSNCHAFSKGWETARRAWKTPSVDSIDDDGVSRETKRTWTCCQGRNPRETKESDHNKAQGVQDRCVDVRTRDGCVEASTGGAAAQRRPGSSRRTRRQTNTRCARNGCLWRRLGRPRCASSRRRIRTHAKSASWTTWPVGSSPGEIQVQGRERRVAREGIRTSVFHRSPAYNCFVDAVAFVPPFIVR